MSRTNQKPSTEMNDVIVNRQFSIRLWDTWEAPSLIVLLDGKDQRSLRETFGIHWADLDVHIRLVDECVGTGVARDQRVRRDKNVKVVYELTWKPEEGIRVTIYIVAMTMGVEKPLLDEQGYPRKLTFERLFPESCLKELFNKANAFVTGMDAFKLALQAKEAGDEKTFQQMGRSLSHFNDCLNGSPDDGGLTVPLAEAARQGGDRKTKKVKAEKIAVGPGAGSTLPDSGFKETIDGIVRDRAGGAPAEVVAPKPKATKIKLGLADLGSLNGQLPPGPSNGSNSQG